MNKEETVAFLKTEKSKWIISQLRQSAKSFNDDGAHTHAALINEVCDRLEKYESI